MPKRLPTVTHSDLKKIFDVLESMKNPPALMIYGVPGIGKSQHIRQRFGKNNVSGKKYDLRIKYLSRMDPTDWSGVPRVIKDHTEFFPPKFLAKPDDPEARVVLFFDEINTALPQVLNSALDIILEKKAEHAELPENTIIICAGNLGEEDGTYVEEFSSAVKTRLIQVILQPIFDDWMNWALENHIHPAVINFLKSHKEFWLDISGFKAGADQIPTPRGWERVSDIIKNCKDNPRVRKALIQGAVGYEVGQLFDDFLRDWLETYGNYDSLKMAIFKLLQELKQSQKSLIPTNFSELFRKLDGLITCSNDDEDLHKVFEQVGKTLLKLSLNVNLLKLVEKIPDKFLDYLEKSQEEDFIKLSKTLREKYNETRK
ncbi:MAG: ATP-binding protein [candidate division WOR-3 bacterium]